MSKTLKIYPDGSVITTKHAAMFATGTLVYCGALAFVIERRERRAQRKIMEKAVKTLRDED